MELQALLEKMNDYYQLYVNESESFILEELASIIGYLKERIIAVLDDDVYLLNHKK